MSVVSVLKSKLYYLIETLLEGLLVEVDHDRAHDRAVHVPLPLLFILSIAALGT